VAIAEPMADRLEMQTGPLQQRLAQIDSDWKQDGDQAQAERPSNVIPMRKPVALSSKRRAGRKPTAFLGGGVACLMALGWVLVVTDNGLGMLESPRAILTNVAGSHSATVPALYAERDVPVSAAAETDGVGNQAAVAPNASEMSEVPPAAPRQNQPIM